MNISIEIEDSGYYAEIIVNNKKCWIELSGGWWEMRSGEQNGFDIPIHRWKVSTRRSIHHIIPIALSKILLE